MTLLLCAGAFPALFAVLALGHGLLVERAAGFSLPGVLLVPLGFAGIVVAAQMTTYFEWAAPATPWVVLALALIGLALGRGRLRAVAVDRWALACAVGVYAALIAPVVLSGQATLAGYGLNGSDVTVHFLGAQYLLDHGFNFRRLMPSQYELTLGQYFGNAYPWGSQTAFGAVRALVGQDVPWVYQPYMAFLVALGALGLFALATRVVASRALCAVIAFLAAQPALVYAYALQGSVKEVAAGSMVVLLGALIPVFAQARDAGPRRVVTLAVAGGGGLGAIGVAFGVWLGPFALAALVLAALDPPRGWRAVAAEGVAFAGALTLLAWPIVAKLGTYLSSTRFLTAKVGLANLLGPLKPVQALGIWPAGDYRRVPTSIGPTYVLAGAAAVAALLGLGWLLRRRAWTVLLFLGVSGVGWAYVTARGSPWADAKALMILSPAVLLSALLGTAALHAAGRRFEALVLTGAIAFGVLWSNALAYHQTALAPRDRLVELGRLGERLAGRGPTLKPEYEEYATYLLRDAAPEGPGEIRHYQPFALRSGAVTEYRHYYDLDELASYYISLFPAIVLRRSPATSRPPAPYRETWRGRFYDAWERRGNTAASVLVHFPLGDSVQPAARPRCADVRALADRARRSRARLAYVPRGRSIALGTARATISRGWTRLGALVVARGAGELNGDLRVPREATYELWVQGSSSRPVTIYLDGRRSGALGSAPTGPGQYAHVADVHLQPGRHVMRAVRGGSDLRPGNGNDGILGEIVLRPRSAIAGPVEETTPSRYRALCGRTLDWIEVVRDGGRAPA